MIDVVAVVSRLAEEGVFLAQQLRESVSANQIENGVFARHIAEDRETDKS